MGWNQSNPVADPQAGAVLDSVTFTHPGPVEVRVTLTSPGPFTALLRRRNRLGKTQQSILLTSPGGTLTFGPFPEINVDNGDALEVVSRDTATGEHQGTLWTKRG